MKRNHLPWGLLAALGLLISACSQSGIIGSDLLQQDQIDIEFTDEVHFNAYIQETDSILIYDPEAGDFLSGYLCGQFADPVFGLTQAAVSAQFRLIPGSPPDFKNAVLDSMVLVLPYRAIRVYGDTTELVQLEAYLLDEDLSDTVKYYSNKVIAATQRIGSAGILPRRYDSLEILQHGADTLIGIPPQIRIRIDDAFAQSLLADTLATKSDTSFIQAYKGIQIRSASQNKGILSINLGSSLTGLTAYYHVDTVARQYIFPLTNLSPRTVSFTHDYTGAPIEAFLQDSTLGDSLLFVQGMSGAGIVLEITDTTLFKNKIINRAELELFVATLPEDGAYAFDPVLQLVVSQIKEDGSLEAIRDVVVGLARQNLPTLFGGVPQDGMPKFYTLNLSAYFKELKNGKASNRILITPLIRAERANRVVIYGPEHSLYPAKIKLSLTDY